MSGELGRLDAPSTPGTAVPVAVSLASSATPSNHLVSKPYDGLRPANTVPSSSASLSPRTGRRGLDELHRSLSARDLAVLRSVAEHRYLTTGQVEGFHFTGHATAATGRSVTRRMLRRLSALRILTHLDRRIGGVRAGSASFVWRVGPVGSRLLQAEASTPRRCSTSRDRSS